jgi:hypothetical protein
MKPLESFAPLAMAEIVALASLAPGCSGASRSVQTTSASVTTGAGGSPALSVRVEPIDPPSKVENALFLKVEDLDPPWKLAPDATVYVVWIQPPGGDVEKVGTLAVGGDRAGTLDAVTPYDQFKITLTPEASAKVSHPSHDPVRFSDVDSPH